MSASTSRRWKIVGVTAALGIGTPLVVGLADHLDLRDRSGDLGPAIVVPAADDAADGAPADSVAADSAGAADSSQASADSPGASPFDPTESRSDDLGNPAWADPSPESADSPTESPADSPVAAPASVPPPPPVGNDDIADGAGAGSTSASSATGADSGVSAATAGSPD